jgi:Cu-Zn family superoxide dismutase
MNVGAGTAMVARRALPIIPLMLVSTACRLPYIPYVTLPAPAAVARLVDVSGRGVGEAVFVQQRKGVRLVLDVTGLAPGTKAVHIHEVGRCDPPSFESAGAHFNPAKAEHGTANPRGPHAGDLPNVTVETGGRGHLEATATRVSLEKGPTSLLDADGSAIVVHERPDDMRTDPAGDSGARIACGVIVPSGRDEPFRIRW